MKLPPIERLRAAEAAARHKSFKLAADEIGVTASAVSHRVRALESELGLSLFKRTGSGVEPTESGKRLVESVARGLTLMQATWTDLCDEARGRPIRISCAPMFASRFLLSRLDDFHALRTNLGLEIVSTNDIADVENSECDIGIRLGRRPPKELYSERLMPVSIVPVCATHSRHKFMPNGRLQGPLLGISHLPDAWEQFDRLSLIELDKDAPKLWFDSLEAILRAAQSGAGIALVPDWLAEESARSHGIMPLLSEPVSSGLSYWMTMRRGEKDSANLALVRRWIKDGVDVRT